MSDSEYTKYFDSVVSECDISNLSEHTLGALFWDKQEEKIEKLEQQLKEKEELIKHLHESCRAYSKSSCDKGLQLIDANYCIDSLIHHFHRYGMDEESLVILMEVEKAREYLTKYKVKE